MAEKDLFKSTAEGILQADMKKVWQALTDPALVKKYFFGSDLVTTWKIGSPVLFRGEWQGKAYEDKGVVKEYKPNKGLAYSYLSSWSGKEDRPENYLTVTYELEKMDKNRTKLRITQTNYTAEAVEDSRKNWLSIIDGMRKIVE